MKTAEFFDVIHKLREIAPEQTYTKIERKNTELKITDFLSKFSCGDLRQFVFFCEWGMNLIDENIRLQIALKLSLGDEWTDGALDCVCYRALFGGRDTFLEVLFNPEIVRNREELASESEFSIIYLVGKIMKERGEKLENEEFKSKIGISWLAPSYKGTTELDIFKKHGKEICPFLWKKYDGDSLLRDLEKDEG